MNYKNLVLYTALTGIIFFHIALYYLKKITGLRWTQLSGTVMVSSFSKEFGTSLPTELKASWKKYRVFIMIAFLGWLLSFATGIVQAIQQK